MFRFLFLFSVLLYSCNQTSKTFKVDNMELILFSDSTFIQDIRLLERKYSISGKWKGDWTEGKTFSIISDNKGIESSEKKQVKIYKIVNGEAIILAK